jgi:sarcosine oxidase delta subunit
MAGERCPYCGNMKPTDFQYEGYAEKDKHSPFQLEWRHDLKRDCDKWFVVVREIPTGKIIANFRRPEDWEQKLLV